MQYHGFLHRADISELEMNGCKALLLCSSEVPVWSCDIFRDLQKGARFVVLQGFKKCVKPRYFCRDG